MVLSSLAEITEAAYTKYTAAERLRAKERAVYDTLQNKHTLHIPQKMRARLMERRSNFAGRVLERAKWLLINDKGPRVTVGLSAVSRQAAADRDRVQEWNQGFLASIERRSVDGVEDKVTEDALIRSRGWARIMPAPWVWAAAPEPSLDFEALDPDAIERSLADWRRKEEAYKQAHLPIWGEWVSAECVYPEFDRAHGLCEVLEIQSVPVAHILATYRHRDGSPMARKLADEVDRAKVPPTDRDVVTLVVRADATHIQYALCSLRLDVGPTRVPDARSWVIQDEIIWEGEHHMRRVPYARCRGRETTDADPVQRYYGFLDRIHWEVRNLDEAKTQLGSAARFSAYPVLAAERQGLSAQSPLQKRQVDKGPVVEWEEGTIIDVPPGVRLYNPGMIHPDTFRLLNLNIEDIKKDLLDLTFEEIVGGDSGGASSGYQYAQQQSNAELILVPWRRGLETFWVDVCELGMAAAAALQRVWGFDPIPIRRVTDREEATFVTLPLRLAEASWDIRVSVRPRPVGGMAALITMLGQLQDRGLLDDVGFLEAIDDRTPSRTLERARIDRLVKSNAANTALEQLLQQRVFAGFTNQALPGQPEQPVISEAIAGALQSPLALARLPQGVAQNAGEMGLPPEGLGAQAGTPGMEQLAPAPGGQVYGQAAPIPGGSQRQVLPFG